MTPERWARIKEVFSSAQEKPENERESFLHQACGSDDALRENVRHLLSAERQAPLESPMPGILHGPAAEVLAADSVIGRYRVERELGAGGMGKVYRAYDTQLRRPVALKVLPSDRQSDPERRERLLREARAASAVSHPNIVGIYEIGSDNSRDFIAMEFVEGESLDKLIPAGGLPLSQALDYSVQTATGLAKAHASGVIHRDLKPANIMVTPDGLVKLLDFGLARRMPVGIDRESGLTVEGEILGTPAYMSPEQAGGKPSDPRSDVFSFGAVLYEMLTGRRAFSGDSPVAVLGAVLYTEPPPAGMPAELAGVLSRCLTKDPARRPEIDEVRQALEDLKEQAMRGRVRRARRAQRKLTVAALVMAGAASALAIFFAVRRTEPPADRMHVAALTSYPGVETAPSLSPDGNQVAFSWNGGKQDNSDIYVKLVDSTGPPLRLTTDPANDHNPAWSPDGRRIAFARIEGDRAGIYSVSPLGGEERRIADCRPPPTQVPRPAWTPDGKRLAVPDQDEQGWRGIALIPLGPGARRKLTSNSLDYDYSAAFSSSGRFLAYVSCADTWACDVYVRELDGDYLPTGQARRVTHQAATIGGIAWTPDGRSLVYEASRDGGINTYLWRVRVSPASAPERLEAAGQQAHLPSIAGLGNRLAFSRGSEDADIWKWEAGAGARPFIASTLYDFNPHYSPDGGRIAFASSRSGMSQVWVCGRDGGNPVQLTEGLGRLAGGPQWSPDGRWIAFSSQADDGKYGVYLMDEAGGRLRRITPPGISAQSASWSRDGKWLYFSTNPTGRLEVWRIRLESGESRQITDQGGFVAYESRDGQTLYYTKTRKPGVTPVFARPLLEGPERLVLDSVFYNAFCVIEGGLLFISRHDPGPFALKSFSFATGRTRTLAEIEPSPFWRMTATPDGKSVVFGAKRPANSDLMLIEGFR